MTDGFATGRSDVLVILPTYNERENLEAVVKSVRRLGHDVLVVDDGSPDGTGELAEQLGAVDAGIHVLRRESKLGLGTAYVAGFSIGLNEGFGFLVEMDADGSHRPEDLDAIVDAARRNGGLSIGTRYIRGGSVAGWPLRRRMLSMAANVYCRMVLRTGARDCTSGFRCYSRELLIAIGLGQVVSQGYSFQIEMAYRASRLGYSLAEVPIRFVDRIAGQSKVSKDEVWQALLTVLRLRFGTHRVAIPLVDTAAQLSNP